MRCLAGFFGRADFPGRVVMEPFLPGATTPVNIRRHFDAG